jgi:hypothetical protein
LDRQEALWLLWKEIAAPYATAHEASRQGCFAEARSLLRPLLQSPVYRDEIQRLDRLCASILGESAGDEDEDKANLLHARADYAAARQSAAIGDLPKALAAVDCCLSTAPCLFTAQKLRMLLLAGSGRGAEAESLRTAVTALFPADPDTTRWKFSGSPALRRISCHRRAVPVILQKTPDGEQEGRGQNKQPLYALPIALGAVAVSVVSLAMSLRPASAPPVPSVPVVSVIPKKEMPVLPDKKRVLSAELAREWEARRRDVDFAQARVWFNRAVQAKNRGNWQECDRFAAAAYDLGKNSYLADESLVLRALAADNRGENQAIRRERYASIAEYTPNSVYVPWALRTALRLAEQDGQTDKAAKYRRLLRLRQIPTGAAREEASGIES